MFTLTVLRRASCLALRTRLVQQTTLPLFACQATRRFSSAPTPTPTPTPSPSQPEKPQSEKPQSANAEEATHAEETASDDKNTEESTQKLNPRKIGTGGPLTWKSVLGVVLVGGCLVYMFNNRLEEQQRRLEAPKQLESIGKPLLGGPFTLVNTRTRAPVTDEQFRDKFMLIYFGFTHCPDVCPDELEKITQVCNRLDATDDSRGKLLPVFITLDPRRDSIDLINEYLKDFHPNFLGLTGTDDQVEDVCRKYRVYFSKGPEDVDGDYLVDHTIISYLVSPNGDFKEFYAKNCNADEMLRRIRKQMFPAPSA